MAVRFLYVIVFLSFISCSLKSKQSTQSESDLNSKKEQDQNNSGLGKAITERDIKSHEMFKLSANSYVCKVKAILTGLVCGKDEIALVDKDSNALKGLIQKWQETPEYRKIMIGFFSSAFQQNQITVSDFIDSVLMKPLKSLPQLVENMGESFGRTVWEIIQKDEPFTRVLTTDSFMMTPALATVYAVLDSFYIDDKDDRRLNKANSLIDEKFKTIKVTFQDKTKIPLSQSVDPRSPNYMKFYIENFKDFFENTKKIAACAYVSPLVLDYKAMRSNALHFFHVLTDFTYTFAKYKNAKEFDNCKLRTPRGGSTPMIPYFGGKDFSEWRMVKIKPPQDPKKESSTLFWDYKAMHESSTLTLNIPRIGFFTTPGFFFNWLSNRGNEHRVTINQTIAVALGRVFDGQDKTAPLSTDNIPKEHMQPGTACYGCHLQMDAMRGFFSSTYGYHEYTLHPHQDRILGSYAFNGVVEAGLSGREGVVQLANLLARDADFPKNWVQKLCYYANSSWCDTEDSEFIAIVKRFKESNFNWNKMVVDLFSSSLVTYQKPSLTLSRNEGMVSITRQQQFCYNLSARLKIDNLCSILSKNTQNIAQALPRNAYSRGEALDVLPSTSNLFFRNSIEKICLEVSTMVVDGDSRYGRYSSGNISAAIEQIIGEFMGVPLAKTSTIKTLLMEHYQESLNNGAKPLDALRSVFTIACTSPYVTSVGI